MLSKETPLAEELRPHEFDKFVGIHQLDQRFVQLCKNGDTLPPSLIFWGPPGSGKTTLARIIGNCFSVKFIEISAVLQGIPDIKKIILEVNKTNKACILFVDEIHRFNKSQQDAFLPHIEKGTIILFGATTENPSFYLNQALLSRTTLIKLNALSEEEIITIINNAQKKLEINLNENQIKSISRASIGDARFALNAIQSLNKMYGDNITDDDLDNFLKKSERFNYDRNADNHYQCISAFIKSLRGSNADAALYWGLHMLQSGEDPRFLFRRLIIFASEDIGNADPRALGIALNASNAFEKIGMPEGQIIFSQCVTYLASAPKSNRSYLALKKALNFVKNNPYTEVPLHLRNADTKIMKKLNYGKGYEYPHDFDYGYAPKQNYFPSNTTSQIFYEPSNYGAEKSIFERLKFWKKLDDN